MSIFNIPDELERRHGIKISYGSVNRVLKKKGVAPLKRERKTRNKEEKKVIKLFITIT